MRKEGPVGNVIRSRLVSHFFLGVPRRGFLRMHVEIPAPCRDAVVEGAFLLDVVFGKYVSPDDTPGLTYADIGTRSDQVGVFKARDVFLPTFEHGPRVPPALHFGLRELVGIAGVGRHADGMNVGLVGGEMKQQAGSVEQLQFSRLVGAQECFAAEVGGVGLAFDVADPEVHRHGLQRSRLLDRDTGPGCDIAITGAVDDDLGPKGDQAGLVCNHHLVNAVVDDVHAARHRVIEHAQPITLFDEHLVGQKLEPFNVVHQNVKRANSLGIGRNDAEAGEVFQRDAANDNLICMFVDQAVEEREPDGRDDAAGETRPFDHHRFGVVSRGSQGGCQPRAPAAANQHIDIFRYHKRTLLPRLSDGTDVEFSPVERDADLQPQLERVLRFSSWFGSPTLLLAVTEILMKLRSVLKRIDSKVRSRLVDFGGPDDVTIVVGMGRSGTTWGADIINYDNSYRILFEPFFPAHVKQASAFEYMQYLDPRADNATLTKQARRILAGKVSGEWVDRDNEGLFYRRRIVKDIRCNLMLGWLRRVANNPPTVLMIRHPLQVVSSWSKLGWGKEALGERGDFEIITSQKALLDDFPVIGEVMKQIDQNDFFERTVFEWGVYHLVPATHLKKNEAYPLFYENLLIDPEPEITRLFQHLKKPMPAPHELSKVMKNSSSTNFLGRDFSQGRAQVLDGWKSAFTSEQIRRASEILSAFGLDGLYDENGRPTGADVFRDSRDARWG